MTNFKPSISVVILPPTVGGSGLKLACLGVVAHRAQILPPTVGGSGLKLGDYAVKLGR